jgi:hypothetical protein
MLFSPGTGFITEEPDGAGGIGADNAGVDGGVSEAQEQNEKDIMGSTNRNEP